MNSAISLGKSLTLLKAGGGEFSYEMLPWYLLKGKTEITLSP